MFTYLLVVIEVLCSILLIGVILLQRTKAQGAGLAFGAGVGESLFGSQVGNVLTRTTVVLGVVFLVNTALLGVLMPGRRRVSVADRIKETPAPAATPAVPPAGGGAAAPGEFGAPAGNAEVPPPSAESAPAPQPAAAPPAGSPAASPGGAETAPVVPGVPSK